MSLFVPCPHQNPFGQEYGFPGVLISFASLKSVTVLSQTNPSGQYSRSASILFVMFWHSFPSGQGEFESVISPESGQKVPD